MAKHDERIDSLVELLDTKIAEAVKNTPKPNYQTNCQLRGLDPSGKFINLQTLQSVGRIAELLGALIMIRDSRHKAAEILGFDMELDWYGFTFTQWIADMKLRADIIRNREVLTELRAKREYFVGKQSADHALDKELAEMEKLMKG